MHRQLPSEFTAGITDYKQHVNHLLICASLISDSEPYSIGLLETVSASGVYLQLSI